MSRGFGWVKKAISKDHRLCASIYVAYQNDQITRKDGK